MNLKGIACKALCGKSCYNAPQRYVELLMKAIPREGNTPRMKFVNDLCRFGAQEPSKLNDIGARINEQIDKNYRQPQKVVALFKIYDELVKTCFADLLKFANYIAMSCTLIVEDRKSLNLEIRAKVFETINKSLTNQTRDLFKGFIERIIGMICWKVKEPRLDFKFRALGMISLQRCYGKQKLDYTDRHIDELARALLENRYIEIQLNEPEENVLKSPKRRERGDFMRILREKVDDKELRRLSLQCFRMLPKETMARGTHLITKAMIKFLEEKRLWKDKEIVRDILSIIVHFTQGPGCLITFLNNRIQKDVKTKNRFMECLKSTINYMHKNSLWLSVGKESELFRILYDYLIQLESEAKRDSEENILRLKNSIIDVIQLLVEKGKKNISNLEVILQRRDIETSPILLEVLCIFGNEMEVPEDIYSKILEYSVSKQIEPLNRVKLLAIIQNSGTLHSFSRKHVQKQAKSKKKKVILEKKVRSFTINQLSIEMQDLLNSRIYEGLLMIDNEPENFVELFFVLLSHMKLYYVSQVRMIFLLNEQQERDILKNYSENHKYRINAFISAYFLILSKTIGKEEEDFIFYIEQKVVKEKIKDGQLPEFFMESLNKSYVDSDRNILKKIFTYDFKNKNLENEHLFNKEIIIKYLSSNDNSVKKELLKSFNKKVPDFEVIPNPGPGFIISSEPSQNENKNVSENEFKKKDPLNFSEKKINELIDNLLGIKNTDHLFQKKKFPKKKKKKSKKKSKEEENEGEYESDSETYSESDFDSDEEEDFDDILEYSEIQELADISLKYSMNLEEKLENILDKLPKDESDFTDIDEREDWEILKPIIEKEKMFNTFEVINLNGFYPI